MKLWLIERTDDVGYDEYDSAVVVAEDEERARLIHPCGYYVWADTRWRLTGSLQPGLYNGWTEPEKVTATLIGEGEHEAGTVICASFNAG